MKHHNNDAVTFLSNVIVPLVGKTKQVKTILFQLIQRIGKKVIEVSKKNYCVYDCWLIN